MTPPTRPAAGHDTARLLEGYRARIEAAKVYDVAVVSALEEARKLSQRLDNRVLLKREDQQSVHSFKLRGAYNRIAQLSAAERARGVITASAGNHAQGVALAARQLGLTAWIVMPRTTPGVKVDSVRALGGKAILHGDAYDDAREHALALAADKGMTLVHPYDDPDVIAGQGTVGRELLEQCGDLDAVFVPVGGGGLLAGVAAWIKSARPKTKVIAVEPDDSNCFDAAMRAGRRVVLPQVGLFADGVAVRQVGEENFRVARHLVDGCVTVSVDEICAATRDLFYENRSLPEPAGALALAGLKRWVHEKRVSGRTLAAIVSGANLNFDRLRHIAERAELGDEAEMLLAVTIPEQPGAYKRFLKQIGKRLITEFNYRYSSAEAAHIFVGIRITDGAEQRAAVLAGLRDAGYDVVDMSGNEMAKLHVRFMVGGRCPGLADERLFRFEFPERPGAALDFLNAIGSRWNISLFHYRNHGAAYGRVLCGLQVPKRQWAECRRSLDALGYAYVEESDNPAYRLFLGTD
ncbi:L-threonine ammonia-lyase [Sinimarinibacterium flocculans]|uniref:L-threonine dehydratase n=1 Tax=Sinimarinibacterium flocculans TaxID=985250 RepID=A0A318E7Z0_9GAMM|nr:L-threonine ammonia-lyase [Sinimarinibacterium flocculans]